MGATVQFITARTLEAGLDVMVKRKIPILCRNSKPRSSSQ